MHDWLVSGLGIWARIKDYVFMATAVALIGMTVNWYITDNKLDNVRLELRAEEAGRLADREGYRRAQAEYEAEQLAEKARIERENNERMRKADEAYNSLVAEYRANLVRWQRDRAPRGTNSGSNLPAAPNPSESSNRSSERTGVPTKYSEYVAISPEDADVCAVNTARLKTVREWALEALNQQP